MDELESSDGLQEAKVKVVTRSVNNVAKVVFNLVFILLSIANFVSNHF